MWHARDTQLTLHINKYLFSCLVAYPPKAFSSTMHLSIVGMSLTRLVWLFIFAENWLGRCHSCAYQQVVLIVQYELQHWNVYMLNCWSMIHLGYVCISVNFRRPVEYLVWWSMHVRLNFLSRGGQCWKIKLLLPLSQITIHFGFSNILVFAIHI